MENNSPDIISGTAEIIDLCDSDSSDCITVETSNGAINSLDSDVITVDEVQVIDLDTVSLEDLAPNLNPSSSTGFSQFFNRTNNFSENAESLLNNRGTSFGGLGRLPKLPRFEQNLTTPLNPFNEEMLSRFPPGETRSIVNAFTTRTSNSSTLPPVELTPQNYQTIYKDILHAVEGKHVSDQNMAEAPKQLSVTLLEHQKVGLNWMLKMESGSIKGGLLSDDMGLGKTIQAIATIVAQKKARLERAHTLVVAPLALIYQWKSEIMDKVKDNYLRANIHHASSKLTVEAMKFQDVVLTTYNTLTAEHNHLDGDRSTSFLRTKAPLFQMNWNRIILDEAHVIKNRNTRAAKACLKLNAKYRWCLTGTPIQNSIDDLFSIVAFLKMKPYCDWSYFKSTLSTGKGSRGIENNFKKIRTLLEAISLRRCKDSQINGVPIITLPQREVIEEKIQFTPNELMFYRKLEEESRNKLDKFIEQGTVRKNYMSILTLLLRLRQACIHPRLTLSKELEFLEQELALTAQPDTNAVEKFNLSDAAFKRLVELDISQAECLLCYEKSENLHFFTPCGHIICSDCSEKLRQSNQWNQCPTCRGPLDYTRIFSFLLFKESHRPITIEIPEVVPSQEDDEMIAEVVSDDSNDCIKAPSSSKIDKLIQLLSQLRSEHPGEKTIVFSQFTASFRIMATQLRKNGFKYKLYDGTMSIVERTEILNEFAKDSSYTVLLLSLRCGSVGLNLTCASRVIFMDLWWNPSVENQAIDRIHRIGQFRNVKVHKLVIPETVEDRILALQKSKQEIFDNAFSTDKAISSRSRLSMGELMQLFQGA